MTKQPNISQSRQHGGTVIGIIIGLIIGLAIALVVAVTITKSSLPFLNKVGKQDKSPELTAGQASDPNKPMYGSNSAAKEAAKDFASTPGTSTNSPPAEKSTTAVNQATNAPTTTASVTKDVAPPADAKPPVATKAAEASPATTAVAKPDNADDKWLYFLQAGAFRDQADAENSKAKLALAGFEANISDRASDNGPLYRVRIGPFSQLEAMNRVRAKLSDNGIDVAVVRIAK